MQWTDTEEAKIIEERGPDPAPKEEGKAGFDDDLDPDPEEIAREEGGQDAPEEEGPIPGVRDETDAKIDPSREEEVEEGEEPDEEIEEPDKGGGKKKAGKQDPWKTCEAMAYMTTFGIDNIGQSIARYGLSPYKTREEIEEDHALSETAFNRLSHAYALKYYQEGAYEKGPGATINRTLLLTYLPFVWEVLPKVIGRMIYDGKQFASWLKSATGNKEQKPPERPKEGPPPEGMEDYEEEVEGGSEELKVEKTPADRKQPRKSGRRKGKGSQETRGRKKGQKKNPYTERYELPVKDEDMDSEDDRTYSWDLSKDQRKRLMKKVQADKLWMLEQYEKPHVIEMIKIEEDPDLSKEEKKRKKEELKGSK